MISSGRFQVVAGEGNIEYLKQELPLLFHLVQRVISSSLILA